jgi:tRNA(adenine34) deaminase
MNELDEKFMMVALKEAIKASEKNEVPVGAVIVKNNVIIARAHNKKEKSKIATAHAEILAINKACKKIGDWRLSDCSIYVTLEPCEMCIGAIKESRINRLIYGTNSKVNKEQINICVVNGVMKRESEKIIKDFFKNKRKLL